MMYRMCQMFMDRPGTQESRGAAGKEFRRDFNKVNEKIVSNAELYEQVAGHGIASSSYL